MNKKVIKSNRQGSDTERKGGSSLGSPSAPTFRTGAIVLATLREPREKIWGALLTLDPAGVSLQGIDLSSFEDATSGVIAGEPLNTAILFFPMHRVERIAMDLPEGTLPSLSQRFKSRTGIEPEEALARTVEPVPAGGAAL